MNVLIVEDHPIQQRIISSILNALGVKTFIKENGQEGLNFMKEGKEKIDLIFSDIKMPIMDGIEFCTKLSEIDKVTPIVVMTCNHESSLEEIKSIKNVTHCLPKPLKIDRIADIIFHNKPIGHSNNKMAYK